MIIPFGEWTPDLPPYKNQGATEAKNVIPHVNSYKPFPGVTVYSDALTARCQGFRADRDKDGNTFVFAGDISKLYELSDAVWGDVSIAAGYNLQGDHTWQFARWGEQMLATNINDPVQTFTMGTSTLFADSQTDVKGKYIAVIRDFLVLGFIADTDGTTSNRVRWSAIGDPTDFTVSASTQSDYQDLEGGGGWVQGVVGGEWGTIFQDRKIWKMTYTGSATVFEFDEIESNRGCLAPNSIIKVGALIYFLSNDGFYVLDGERAISISHGKISKTFFADVDGNYYDRINATIDLQYQTIMWAYPSTASSNGICDKILIYNYGSSSTTKWSWVELTTEYLGHTSTGEYTLEGLDAVNTSIDAMQISFDSRVWKGNSDYLGVFDGDHKLNYFTGTSLDAIIETGESDVGDGNHVRINKIRPLVNGASTVTIQVSSRNRQQDSITWGSAASVQTSGNVAVRSTGLYHRVRANITGGFTDAQGIEIIEAQQTGKR